MKNATSERQSLLADAFGVLLKNLGPQKTTQLRQVLVGPRGDYLETRNKLFPASVSRSFIAPQRNSIENKL
jgi:hypothetical protein